MIANAQRRDLRGQRVEDRKPERENEQAAPIWLKKPQNNRTRGLLVAKGVFGGFFSESKAKEGIQGKGGSAKEKRQPRESLGVEVKNPESCK